MATRKKPRRPAKKATTKRTNSKISEAQKAVSEKRLEQDSLRGQSGAERAKQTGRPGMLRFSHPLSDGKPAQPAPSGQSGTGQEKQAPWSPGDPYAVIDGPVRTTKTNEPASRGEQIAGLTLGLGMAPGSPKKTADAIGPAEKLPLANPGLYGASPAKRASNLTDLMAANADAETKDLKAKGNAVYMGPTSTTAKIRNRGPERFNDDGSTTTTQSTGEQVVNKNTLMAWLSDETKVAQIKDAATKAGLTVTTYDDISKLWASVVSQAASSFSLGGQRVTPWALIQLRGKYVDPNTGRPQDKVTTSTNIEEMAPETARAMFETTVADQLGRAPTKAELDDFIAKAQTIAQQNPAVTTTNAHIGFDGNVTNQTSYTTGGTSVVKDKAQAAAMDQAKQSEDYASYQAAGNYFPMLFQALQAPV